MSFSVLFSAGLVWLSGCSQNQQFAPGSGRDKLEGFLDIKWGEPPDSVNAKMLRRSGVRLDSTDGYRLLFSGGEFAGYIVREWDLRYTAKGFFSAYVFIESEAEPDLQRCYERIKRLFEDRFGKVRTFAKGRVAIWRLPARDSFNDRLSVSMVTGKRVTVIFENGERNPVDIAPQETPE